MSQRELTLTGYIRSDGVDFQSNQDDVEIENEEEEIEPEFLDMNEVNCVSSGGKIFKTSMPALKEVLLVTGNRTYKVTGQFHLCDPWWKVTCRVNRGRHRFFTLRSSYPSYSLRTNLRSEGRSLVSLFLKECEADPLFVNMFMEWLPNDTDVEPVNVLDVLKDFEVSAPEHKAVAEQLKSNVINSVAWTRVRVASMYPQIMKYFPTLLPGQFMEIISNGKMKNTQDTTEETPQQQSNTDLLENLEKLIENDVWKLGFSYIMFKEFRMIRCEAKMKSFELCNLLRRIPEVQQNALQLYEKLKHYCRETGSTYIEQKMLLEKMQQWKIAFEGALFLNEQEVLIKENNKVALHNLFSYEIDIAECLRALVEGDPWKIHLDVRKVLQRAAMERLTGKACDARTSTSEQNDMEQGIGCKQKDEAQPGSSSMDHNGGMASHCDSPQSPVSETIIKRDDSYFDSNDSTYSDIDPSTTELDPDQVRAAEMMCANPVTVISGKGGCGKTTLVSLVFKAAVQKQTSKSDSDEKPPVEVLLTAPTGRAASLLTKRTGFTAYTVHQVLWSFMNAKKDQSGNPQEWMFSKVRVLVVDEGSLVSVQILHSILSMLTKHSKLQKFIILGDVRQLPSIEPGSTLCDLFEGLQKVRWAIEMRTNHRAESELIVRNAVLISEMGKRMSYHPLEFDAIIKMTNPSTVPSDKGFIFVQISEKNDALEEAIQFLLEKAPGLKDHRSSQIVAFMRKDCQEINELCCNHYSRHSTMTPEKKICFQMGDKVCCTKNGYISDKDDENMQEEPAHDAAGTSQDIPSTQRKNERMKENRQRMCNGEIFFIIGDVTEVDMGARRKTRYLTLDDKNGRVVTSKYSELQRECKLRHAWARTIHTFQGSEAETIVYVLGSCGENWQHVYTAVTRGQKRVYVVGRERNLKRAIVKKITPRNTRLRGRVKEIVAQQGPKDSFAQSDCRQSHVETPVNHGPSQSTPVASKRPAQSDPCTTQSKLMKQTTSEEPLLDSASPKSLCEELP
ncbi:DNA helicase B-like [Sinocyclocheilus rhinocerous]|uniref:DNA helicase B-like n=1 Tax=Sinocyclocheilus rhinocerous TaxID=307959 RepID=UPI0007B7EA7D|nr:PREDICTED: DNA helicase B-like [Sinocyclocheilus rhinocerous]